MRKDADSKIDDYLFVLNVLLEELSKTDDSRYKLMRRSIEDGIKRIVSEREIPERKREILRGLRESIKDIPNVILRLPPKSVEILNKAAVEKLGRRIEMATSTEFSGEGEGA